LILLALPQVQAESSLPKLDFTLPDVRAVEPSQTISLSDFRGQWVIVNFWATWCPPCRKEMPDLQDFHAKHQKTGKAVVLAVNFHEEDLAAVRAFLNDLWLEFPVVSAVPGAALEGFRVRGLPTTYVIHPEGCAVAREEGEITAADLERFIDNYEKEGKGCTA
jgi:thiol-disulfide isomerase/thioredoxin